MDNFKKIRQRLDKVLSTVAVIILLLAVMLVMINHTYKFSERTAFDRMHLETQQIKKNINLQMMSDRENLITMANFASKLYKNGESYELLFESFEEIGLFENIGILLPDNRFVTKIGNLDVSGKISFEEEAARGEYISGRIKDITNDEKEVVRSSVPVEAEDGTTVAVLYGVIDLDTLKDRYADDAAAVGAQLYVLEGGTGNYIIDTRHSSLGNVTALATSSFQKGYSYDEMLENLTAGESGYAAFMAQSGNDLLYAHYAPLDISDWRIMLSQPEEIVFAGAKSTSNYLAFMAALIILIMLVYILFIVISERKKLKINITASNIRRNLLEVNQQFDKIYDALKAVTIFARARSSFVVDAYGEDYNYILPALEDKLLSGDDRKYFIMQILNYAAKHRTEHGAAIYIAEITANDNLNNEAPDFYEFIKLHDIEKICIAIVVTGSSNTSIIGIINPRKRMIVELVKDIAICFSMAIHNRKYLVRTEAMALTDALTGAKNRMAYKQDMKYMDISGQESFACIYIDVNELHYFNGQYGHAAGDQMLAFIAETLKKEFSDDCTYRMGGDEFLVFCHGLSPEVLESKMKDAKTKIEEMKYHISIGIKYADGNLSVEELVNEAEKAMRDAKAKYYQNKEVKKISRLANRKMEADLTGIKEIDALISVISVHCLGIFCVSHKIDQSIQVLSPSYFSEMLEETKHFSIALRKYIHDIVKPEYHRVLFSFLDYEVLERQLENGVNPKVTYTKIDGENVTLSIYSSAEKHDDDIDTVWFFEKGETKDCE